MGKKSRGEPGRDSGSTLHFLWVRRMGNQGKRRSKKRRKKGELWKRKGEGGQDSNGRPIRMDDD